MPAFALFVPSYICTSSRAATARSRVRSQPGDPTFFFTSTATTEIYTLSLHDALPISTAAARPQELDTACRSSRGSGTIDMRSEEHTSELQSLTNLVCRLLLEKKKVTHKTLRRIIERINELHLDAKPERKFVGLVTGGW